MVVKISFSSEGDEVVVWWLFRMKVFRGRWENPRPPLIGVDGMVGGLCSSLSLRYRYRYRQAREAMRRMTAEMERGMMNVAVEGGALDKRS